MNRVQGALIQLPNGDLWSGHVRAPKQVDNVEIGAAPRPFAKIDEAMASIMQASKGAKNLTCIWCGFQAEAKSNQMREHLKANHASVVEPPTNEQLALAAAVNQTADATTEE